MTERAADAPNEPTRSRSMSWLVLGAMAALTIAAIVSVVLAFSDDGSSPSAAPEATDPPRETTTTLPPTTTLVGTGIHDAIDDAVAFVEALRGHQLSPRPGVAIVPDADFDDWSTAGIRGALEADPDYFRVSNVIDRGFGLIGPVDDIAEIRQVDAVLGVVARYDGNMLFVREREVTPYLRLALVHELTNALDDQLVDFDRPELAALDNDAQFAFEALVEGDAARAERLYRETFSGDDLRLLADEEAEWDRRIDEADIPLPISVYWAALAKYGDAFVDGLFEHDGNTAIDDAFRSPPTTSEQIFYVNSYFGREPNRNIFHPVADSNQVVIAEGPLGQVAIMAILRSVHDENVAWEAANGWAGDWFVAWQNGTSSCVRTTMVMETYDEAKELKAAFDEWGLEQFGRYIVYYEEDRVVVTNCVG